MANNRTIQAFPTRKTVLGDGLNIQRALPNRQLRLVGPWCFLDYFGPTDLKHSRNELEDISGATPKGMKVGPHPHIGLQTVSWLFAGEILHQDSLGYEQLIKPKQLNLMTAGNGITHAETSSPQYNAVMHGIQLWIALPEHARHGPAYFDHYPILPSDQQDGIHIIVLIGEALGMASPARHFSAIVGLDVTITHAGNYSLPLETDFEHAILPIDGEIEIDKQLMSANTLYYLGKQRDQLSINSKNQARFILIGGEPFKENILLWWNFVARNNEEIQQARNDWQAGKHFGTIENYNGARIDAPELTYKLSTQ